MFIVMVRMWSRRTCRLHTCTWSQQVCRIRGHACMKISSFTTSQLTHEDGKPSDYSMRVWRRWRYQLHLGFVNYGSVQSWFCSLIMPIDGVTKCYHPNNHLDHILISSRHILSVGIYNGTLNKCYWLSEYQIHWGNALYIEANDTSFHSSSMRD